MVFRRFVRWRRGSFGLPLALGLLCCRAPCRSCVSCFLVAPPVGLVLCLSLAVGLLRSPCWCFVSWFFCAPSAGLVLCSSLALGLLRLPCRFFAVVLLRSPCRFFVSWFLLALLCFLFGFFCCCARVAVLFGRWPGFVVSVLFSWLVFVCLCCVLSSSTQGWSVGG